MTEQTDPFYGLPYQAPVPEMDRMAESQAVEEVRKESEKDFGSLYDLAVDDSHIVNRISDYQARAQFEPDEDWDKTVDNALQDLNNLGIPMMYLEDLLEAQSEGEYQMRLQQYAAASERNMQLGQNGWRGVGAAIAGSASDPLGLAIDAAATFAGGAGLVRRAKQLDNITDMAQRAQAARALAAQRYAAGIGTAGVASVAVGAAQAADDPTYGFTQGLIDFAAGATAGAVLDARSFYLDRKEAVEFHNTAQRLIRQHVDRTVGPTTPGDDSLSAARVRGSEVEVDTRLDVAVRSKAGGDARKRILEVADEVDGITGWGLQLRKMIFGGTISARLRGASDREVKAIGHILVSDDVKAVDHTGRAVVNAASAEDLSLIYKKQLFIPFRRQYEDALKSLGGSLKGNAKRILSQDYRRQINREVGQYMRGLIKDVSPEARRIATAARQALDEAYMLAVEAGVRGATLKNKLVDYLPRIPKRHLYQYLTQKLASQTGVDDKVKELIAKGIRSAREQKGLDYDETVTNAVATAYMRRLLDNPASRNGADSGLTVREFDDIAEIIENSSLTPDEQVRVIHWFEQKDSNTAEGSAPTGRLKHRLQMDDSVSVKLDNGDTLTLAELFEDDVEMLVERYIAEMGGQAALARQGIDDWRQLERALKDLHSQRLATDSEHEAATIALNAIIGKQLVPGSTWDPVVRTVMGVNFVQKMGGTFFSMFPELGATIAVGGLRASLQQFPALKSAIKQVVTGTAPDELGRELAALAEPGTSLISNPVSLRLDDIGQYGEFSNKYARIGDAALAGAQRLTAIVGGTGSVQDMLQINFSKVFAQKLFNWAKDPSVIKQAWRDRLKDYGIGDADLAALMDHLKSHGVEKDGRLVAVGLDKMDPDLQEKVSVLFSRATRHIIQEQNIGATFPWMTNPFMRVALQFMVYPLVAAQRRTLHAVSRLDMTAGMMFMMGMGFAAAGVAGRTYIQHPSDSEYRKKLLEDPTTLAKAAFSATGESTLVPMMFDTVLDFIGEEKFFNNYHRSSGLATNFLTGNPTVDLVNRISQAMKIPTRLIRPDQEVSKEQMEAFYGLIPLNTAVAIQRFTRWHASQFPKERELEDD